MEKTPEPVDPAGPLDIVPTSTAAAAPHVPAAPLAGARKLELTWQAVVVAFIVSVLVSGAYPYVVLKLGMGPNASVVSAFLGAVLLLGLARQTHGRNRLMNSIVQTAGTSAASMAFMCVVAAAVQLAAENPAAQDKMNGIGTIEPLPMFLWLFSAGGIGVLFSVLFRRHFLDDPKMVFADGVAAAETIIVLDSPGPESRGKLQTLGISALLSAVVAGVRDIFHVLHETFFSPMSRALLIGIEYGLLNIGTGILIGLHVCLSMLAATVVVWITGPMLIESGVGKQIVASGIADRAVTLTPSPASPVAVLATNTPFGAVAMLGATEVELEKGRQPVNAREECSRLIDKSWNSLTLQEAQFVKAHGNRQKDYMRERYFSVLLLWYMWPATALMISAAITAVALKWRTVMESFTHLRAQARSGQSEDVSLTTIIVGVTVLTVLLAIALNMSFGMSYLQTAIAVLCSLPLILVGIRVLGETNNGPVSVMMNGLQAIFAVFWPYSIGHNLIASGVAGSCNAQGQGTIQDYKTGKLVGSTPRILTWAQLAAVPIGAASVAIMYPILTTVYRLGEELTTPTGVKIAGMAILLAQGIEALPAGALEWTIIGTIAGIGLTLAVHFWQIEWLPSAAGFGFGLILPGTLNIPITIGGILGWLWWRQHKTSYDRYAVTVASGFIAGEALLSGLILPIVATLSR